MSGKSFPPCPASLKSIQHYLKAAQEHEDRDIIISYWCRLYALQLGLKTDRSGQEAKKLLGHLMDWLEKTKAQQNDNESISNDIAAQAHLENYAFRLFVWADSQDRSGTFNKNVVKAFYTAGIIYDVLDTFGDVSEDVLQNKKYAKWKAAYIHNCIKNGETPVPGPLKSGEDLNEPSSSSVTPYNPKNHPSDASTLGFGHSSSVFPVVKDLPPSEVLSDTDKKPVEMRDSSLDANGLGTTSEGVQLTPEQMNKAQKYCKWAGSALNYDDIPTAVLNLQKALQLLTTGVDE